MGRPLLFIPALLALPLITEGSGDAALDRATMRGLKSVNVVLDPLAPELQKGGLTKTDLETRLTERLKRANIPLDRSVDEFVGLRITAVQGTRGRFGGGAFALALNLGLYQPVVLVRDKDMKSATSTWDVETVLMADPKALQQATAESIDDLADRFVTAWRSVNPE